MAEHSCLLLLAFYRSGRNSVISTLLGRIIYRSCDASLVIRWDSLRVERVLMTSHLQDVFVAIHSLSGELSQRGIRLVETLQPRQLSFTRRVAYE